MKSISNCLLLKVTTNLATKHLCGLAEASASSAVICQPYWIVTGQYRVILIGFLAQSTFAYFHFF